MAMEQIPLNFEEENKEEQKELKPREQVRPAEEKTYEEKVAEIRARSKGPSVEYGDSSIWSVRAKNEKKRKK